MRIVVTGGGTGGHVTPLKPVIQELKRIDPSVELMFIAQSGDRFAGLIEEGADVDSIKYIKAGKYRRFPDETLLQRVLDVQTHVLNVRDVFRTAGATAKSYRILKKFKADVVFCNGGYVSVPVGWAAHRLNMPVILHESDARPGIATRLLTSRASKILFGVPARTTTLGGKAVEFIGIPLRRAFTDKEKLSKKQIKKKLGYDENKPLVTISGSSLGAEAINNAVVKTLPQLLEVMQIAHITGADHLKPVTDALGDDAEQPGYQALDFVNNIDLYFKASDIVVNRASATIFTELAALGKATILIPAPQLSDQVENAEILGEKGVVQILEQAELDEHPEILANRLVELLEDKKERGRLEEEIVKLAKPKAAQELAKIIHSFGGGKSDG